MIYAQDWTGSASQRRPQGSCKPPKPSTGILNCEVVPAGTPVLVRPLRGGSKQWKHHTTKIDLQIKATIKRTSKSVMFAQDGFVVAVALCHICPAQGQGRV